MENNIRYTRIAGIFGVGVGKYFVVFVVQLQTIEYLPTNE